jgi:hypothetical protein
MLSTDDEMSPCQGELTCNAKLGHASRVSLLHAQRKSHAAPVPGGVSLPPPRSCTGPLALATKCGGSAWRMGKDSPAPAQNVVFLRRAELFGNFSLAMPLSAMKVFQGSMVHEEVIVQFEDEARCLSSVGAYWEHKKPSSDGRCEACT